MGERDPNHIFRTGYLVFSLGFLITLLGCNENSSLPQKSKKFNLTSSVVNKKDFQGKTSSAPSPIALESGLFEAFTSPLSLVEKEGGPLYSMGGSGDSTAITSLPFTITQPGNYHLDTDLVGTEGIYIENVDNISIDGRNHLVTITQPKDFFHAKFCDHIEVRNFRLQYNNLGGARSLKTQFSNDIQFSNIKGTAPAFSFTTGTEVHATDLDLRGSGYSGNDIITFGNSAGGCSNCSLTNSYIEIEASIPDMEGLWISSRISNESPDGHDILIENNTLKFLGSSDNEYMQLQAARNVIFRNNYIYADSQNGMITLRDLSINFVFENNVIETLGGGIYNGKGNVEPWKKSHGTVFRNNIIKVRGNGYPAIRFSNGTYDTKVYGNVIVMETGNAVVGYQGAEGNHELYNNTIVNLGSTQTLDFSGGSISHIDVKGNIFATKTGKMLTTDGSNWNSRVTLDNNLYYQEMPQSTLLEWNGNNYSTFLSFKNATPFEDNGINANPKFLSSGNLATHYSVLSSSPAIDSGDSSVVNWSEDLAGFQRIQGASVDMGAYEHGGIVSDGEENIAPIGIEKSFSVSDNHSILFPLEFYDSDGPGPYIGDIWTHSTVGVLEVVDDTVSMGEEQKLWARFTPTPGLSSRPYSASIYFVVWDGLDSSRVKSVKIVIQPNRAPSHGSAPVEQY